LETSFPTAFQQLNIRDGDLGLSLPGNEAKASGRSGAAKRTYFDTVFCLATMWGDG
jgi:hypothetical protein